MTPLDTTGSLGLFGHDPVWLVILKAVLIFVILVVLTLFITKWAASRTKSAADFYTAGGGITGFQNGLAIAGDYMSAASFLGIYTDKGILAVDPFVSIVLMTPAAFANPFPSTANSSGVPIRAGAAARVEDR